MLQQILIASLLTGSACAVYLEYLQVDSNDLTHGNLVSSASDGFVDMDQDLGLGMEKIPGVCLMCKEVIKRVKKQLGNHENLEKIKEKLRKVCDKIPVGKMICKKQMNKHLDILVKELSTDDNPKIICAKAGMCKSWDILKLMQVFPQNLQIL